MSENKDDIGNTGRAPRNYRFTPNASNNNEDEKDFHPVHLPEGPNTHNIRQNYHGNQTSEPKSQDNETPSLPIKHRKSLHKSTQYKSNRRIRRPSQQPNQTKPIQNPPTSTNQSHLPQYQQQQQSPTTSTNQSQSHLPQFPQQKRFTQNPVQSNQEQQQQSNQLPQFQPQKRFTQNPIQPTQQQPNPLPSFRHPNRFSAKNQSSTFSETSQIKWPHHSNKLPQNYVPTLYDLYLNFTKETNEIEGIVTITFEKKEKSDSIFLNVDINININSILQNGKELEYAVKYPFLFIKQSKEQGVEISTYPITINYTVKPYNTISIPFHLRTKDDDEKGLFTCDGSYMTHFEPNNTRKLLPCFDEPYPKSSFKVKLRIPSNLQGISNMPVENITQNEREKEIIFKKTPPMCAYLLCICVGPFTSIQEKTKSGLPIKIYSLNSSKPIYKGFMKIAIFTIEWFERKFKVSFDLPHLQIVSHKGFCHYAMENYGLITCPDDSEWMEKNGQFVIAHEIIHQWFGDSVSIKWWDSIWLNEGFASFLEYIIMNEFGFKSDIWEEFANNKAPNALSFFDNGIISPPSNSIDFENMFDQLLYSKGAYIVKMFYDMIGQDDFFKLCSNWLINFKNQSVDISDFLSLVNKILKKNYNDFFNPWLKNVGFPFLFVSEIVSDDKIVGIKIDQKMNDFVYQFNVPIMYSKNGQNKVINVMLDELSKKVEIDFDWVIVNYKIGSLCYVCYSNSLINKLAKLPRENKISKFDIYLINKSIERKQLIQFRSHRFGFYRDPFSDE